MGGPPAPSASPARLTQPDLQYRVIEAVGTPVYCDRTRFPVARIGDPAAVAGMVAALRSQNPDEFDAIVRHEHLDAASLSDADNVRVVGQSSMLEAVRLTPRDAGYGFAYEVAGPPTAEVTGTVDAAGAVTVATRTPAPRRPCPICLAAWTTIATPAGDVPVTAVRPGTLVWTEDENGRRVAAVVLASGHTIAPAGHQVVHLVLADGRSVDVSPGHPLPDGRPVGDLRPGDRAGGSVVVSVDRRPYGGAATWDLLPAGPSRVYWADGIPLRSTLTS